MPWDLFSFDEQEIRKREVLEFVGSKMPEVEVAAMYIPPAEDFNAEPSFAVFKKNQYYFYQILRGHILFRDSVLSVRPELPNDKWIEI